MEIGAAKTQMGIRSYPLHRHDTYEVMYYTEGVGEMRTEYGAFPFSAGTVVIVPPRTQHGSVSENGFSNLSITGDFGMLFCFERPVAFVDRKGDGFLLARLIYENRYGDYAYLASLCQSYAHYLLRRYGDVQNGCHSIRLLAERISESAFDCHIDVARILRESGFAEDYARACFKREIGKTPLQYLTSIRIRRARALIDVYGDTLSLFRIAEQCGYTDYVYFSRKFKETCGMSPRAYQARTHG